LQTLFGSADDDWMSRVFQPQRDALFNLEKFAGFPKGKEPEQSKPSRPSEDHQFPDKNITNSF